MESFERLCPRTATLDSSIWRDLSEDTFRQYVVSLEQRTNAVPVEPEEFHVFEDASHTRYGDEHAARLLPLASEQLLANNIAAIVAVEQGAQSVSAVCIEEHINGQGMTVRVAAVDAINPNLRLLLQTIFRQMSIASEVPNSDVDSVVQSLFEQIVAQHYAKILGRLRSLKWDKPTYLSRSHKKPLWQDFDNLVHRVQFLYTKQEAALRTNLEQQLHDLTGMYKTFEVIEAGSDSEFEALSQLIKFSYGFCISESARVFASRLNNASRVTAQIGAAIKCLHQIEKIAAYWRVAKDLVDLARQFPWLLQAVTCEYLVPYSAVRSDIAYETWAKVCHVHAEVQLVIYYDTHCQLQHRQHVVLNRNSSTTFTPRCIGTSKYLCYLCYLFLKSRNLSLLKLSAKTRQRQIHVANTHGRLYDQWTIPDLGTFKSDVVYLYRDTIDTMSREIRGLTQQIAQELEDEQYRCVEGRGNGKRRTTDGKLVRWKAEPMTSRENLLLTRHDQHHDQLKPK